MADLLAQSDIYVSTSLYDGASVSLLEAIGSGAFPVVTNIPANQEWIVDGKNGYLVPTEESGVLAKRILEAIHNGELLERSRKDNLALVQKKALWLTNIPRIRELYSKPSLNMA
jgi:glycosyltransferase involved in cell wall biosynthesis